MYLNFKIYSSICCIDVIIKKIQKIKMLQDKMLFLGIQMRNYSDIS